MLLQFHIETYRTNDDYLLYAINNGHFQEKTGSANLPGLKIILEYVSYEKWCKDIWPHVEIEEVGDEGILCDEAIREIAFGILSGEHRSIGGWKITGVEYFSAGKLCLSLRNKHLDAQRIFLANREFALNQHGQLTKNVPGCYYSLTFNVANKKQGLSFRIKPSKMDDCQYELHLEKEMFSVDESSPKHYRRIVFGEFTKDGDYEMCKARITEGYAH